MNTDLLQPRDLNQLSRISSVQSALTVKANVVNLDNIVDLAESWEDLIKNPKLQNVQSHAELRQSPIGKENNFVKKSINKVGFLHGSKIEISKIRIP